MKDCCTSLLGPPETPKADKPELTVRVCKECGAKHFELDADALKLNLTGSGLGG